MKYKVWIHVEETDDIDHFQDIGLPEFVGEFPTIEAARSCVADLQDLSVEYEPLP